MKTGKRWYLPRHAKRSVCVESRKWSDRDWIRTVADWCYKRIYSQPSARAKQCTFPCEQKKTYNDPQ